MEAFLAYTFSIYSAILVPFGTPDFGPKLATGLLALAAGVFLGFLCFALPQSYRLRSALVTIRGKSDNETEQKKRTAWGALFISFSASTHLRSRYLSMPVCWWTLNVFGKIGERRRPS